MIRRTTNINSKNNSVQHEPERQKAELKLSVNRSTSQKLRWSYSKVARHVCSTFFVSVLTLVLVDRVQKLLLLPEEDKYIQPTLRRSNNDITLAKDGNGISSENDVDKFLGHPSMTYVDSTNNEAEYSDDSSHNVVTVQGIVKLLPANYSEDYSIEDDECTLADPYYEHLPDVTTPTCNDVHAMGLTYTSLSGLSTGSLQHINTGGYNTVWRLDSYEDKLILKVCYFLYLILSDTRLFIFYPYAHIIRIITRCKNQLVSSKKETWIKTVVTCLYQD